MVTHEESAREAVKCLLRFIDGTDDLHEIQQAARYLEETYTDEYRPAPPVPTYRDFVAGLQQWKERNK